jgi:hypothetical protein
MKTAINQSVTVLSLFTFAFATTLAISWGITQVVYPVNNNVEKPFNNTLILHVEKDVKHDITRAFKQLIPKLK